MKSEVGRGSTFTFTRDPSYIASVLFANVIKFFCSYARKNHATVEGPKAVVAFSKRH